MKRFPELPPTRTTPPAASSTMTGAVVPVKKRTEMQS